MISCGIIHLTEYFVTVKKRLQLVGRLWVFFLSHTAPGFQLWFYFHLCTWVIHWGLLLTWGEGACTGVSWGQQWGSCTPRGQGNVQSQVC